MHDSLSLSERISVALCAIKVNQFLENWNDCHDEKGMFCEGGGSGSGAGGSYTPMRASKGFVSAGTFPMHKIGEPEAEKSTKDISKMSFEEMPGWKNLKSEHSVETEWGQTVEPKVWKKGEKERLYIPMESTHSGTKGKSQNAGYITKDKNDTKYSNVAQEYRGLHIVPDSLGRTGKMKRAVDSLLG